MLKCQDHEGQRKTNERMYISLFFSEVPEEAEHVIVRGLLEAQLLKHSILYPLTSIVKQLKQLFWGSKSPSGAVGA